MKYDLVFLYFILLFYHYFYVAFNAIQTMTPFEIWHFTVFDIRPIR